MSQEIYNKLRGMIRRVTLKNVNDDGQMQTASVEVADGIWRDNVEISQQYGIASNAPEDGALGIAIAIGGDEGDMVLLPVGNPSARMGGLAKGAVGIYNAHGDKMIIQPGGGIEIQAAGSIKLTVDGVSVTISGAGVAIQGGTFTHDGKNIGKDHGHVTAPPGPSGPPV